MKREIGQISSIISEDLRLKTSTDSYHVDSETPTNKSARVRWRQCWPGALPGRYGSPRMLIKP
jgi:hypothetical protein